MGLTVSAVKANTSQTQHGKSDEGNEEEDCEQGCQGPLRQVCGAAREQGKDCGRLDEVRSEQEAERACQEEVCQLCWTLDAGCQEGTCGPQGQGFRRDQEGFSTLHQGEGILQQLRLACLSVCYMNTLQCQLQVWGILRLSSAWRSHTVSCCY